MSTRRKIAAIIGVGILALAGIIVYFTLRGDPTGIFSKSANTTTSTSTAPGEKQAVAAQTPPPPPLPPGVVSHCGENKYVALTFDDGPWIVNNNVDGFPATAHVLDELKANGLVATFFIAPGSNGGHYGPQECQLVRRMLNEGHEVQWHTWNHVDLLSSQTNIDHEVNSCRNWLAKQCQVPASASSFTMLRPPFGNTNEEKNGQLNRLGLTSVIWNVDSNDWKGLSYDQIQANIEKESGRQTSKLILMHDMWYHTGTLAWLKQRFADYQFVTVSQCYQACGSPTQCFEPLP